MTGAGGAGVSVGGRLVVVGDWCLQSGGGAGRRGRVVEVVVDWWWW